MQNSLTPIESPSRPPVEMRWSSLESGVVADATPAPIRKKGVRGNQIVCPHCKGMTTVKDSRGCAKNQIRRRRLCNKCGYRFSTYEVISEVQPEVPDQKIKKYEQAQNLFLKLKEFVADVEVIA